MQISKNIVYRRIYSQKEKPWRDIGYFIIITVAPIVFVVSRTIMLSHHGLPSASLLPLPVLSSTLFLMEFWLAPRRPPLSLLQVSFSRPTFLFSILKHGFSHLPALVDCPCSPLTLRTAAVWPFWLMISILYTSICVGVAQRKLILWNIVNNRFRSCSASCSSWLLTCSSLTSESRDNLASSISWSWIHDARTTRLSRQRRRNQVRASESKTETRRRAGKEDMRGRGINQEKSCHSSHCKYAINLVYTPVYCYWIDFHCFYDCLSETELRIGMWTWRISL